MCRKCCECKFLKGELERVVRSVDVNCRYGDGFFDDVGCQTDSDLSTSGISVSVDRECQTSSDFHQSSVRQVCHSSHVGCQTSLSSSSLPSKAAIKDVSTSPLLNNASLSTSYATAVSSSVSSSKTVSVESISSSRKCLKGKAICIGDSMVRSVRDIFCRNEYRGEHMSVCLPGARIEHITGVIRQLKNFEQVCIIHVGTNNLKEKGKRGFYEDIQGKYLELLRECGKKDKVKFVFSGILPRANEYLNALAVEMNRWLERECRERGFSFISLWGEFLKNFDSLVKLDGLHPTGMGARYMAKVFIQQVNKWKGSLN